MSEQRERVRVSVTSGDGETKLGLGWLVGRVSVFYFASLTSVEIQSLHDCESQPSQDMIDAMQKRGYELVESERNPKITLDSGDVVYGCQVWWQPVSAPDPRAQGGE